MLARLFVIVGGLVVLALTLALVGPYFVNWTSYRADFEREASAILGRNVTVEGGVTARILPFPSVTFSDVVVAGASPDAPALTAETFSMDAELAPFMRGEFLIFDMRLVRPKVSISVAADGTVDWAMRPSAPFKASQISLERLTVTDGLISIHHLASGRTHLVSDVDAAISARSFAGPWRADGKLKVDGLPVLLAMSTGKVDATGAMRLRIKADPANLPAVVETDGDVRLEKGALRYSGSFRMVAGSSGQGELPGGAARSPNTGTGKPAKDVPPPFRFNGRFAFDHQRLSADEFRFETGPLDDPYTADGSAFVDIGAEPNFSVDAHGAQIRFDEAVGARETVKGITLAGRIAAVEKALVSLPKPTIPGVIDINLPAVVAGDTTIRDVRLSAAPAAEGWNVKSMAATLPGRATLEGSGLLRTDGELGFAGSLLLAVKQPSGFAAWLAKDVDDAIRRIPAAGFRANVHMTSQRQRFEDLELILGPAKFRGRIDNRQPYDAKPSMQVELTGDALDVDGMLAFTSLFVSEKGVNRLADHDLDFNITAGPVHVAGLTAETVDTALRLRDRTLEIDRLSIGALSGATISATGKVRDFPQNPSGNLDASILAVDLAPLISGLADHYPSNALLRELRKRESAYPGLFTDSQIDLVASAVPGNDGASDVALTANGVSGGSEFSLTASGNGKTDSLETADLSLLLTAKNSNAEALMALYGLPALPLGVTGNGETSLEARGTLAGGLATTVGFTGVDTQARFAGQVTAQHDALSAAGTIRLQASDIEPWLMTAGASLPGMGLGLPVELASDLQYAKGILHLSTVEGTIEESAVSGDVRVEMKEGLPHLTGALVLDELELAPAVAMVLGETALQRDGTGWPAAAFQDSVSAPFTAELDLSASTLSAGPLGAASDVHMAARLDREGMRLSGISGKAYDGQLDGLVELKNTDGTGLFSAQLKLTGADLGTAFTATRFTGRGDMTASVSATGKSVEAMVAALTGSGTAALHGLTIAGLNPQAFQAIIARADEIGSDVDAVKIAAFAPSIAESGEFAVGDAELAFTIAGGVLRAPPVSLENPAATLTAEVGADLNDGTLKAAGAVVYNPGEESLVGSEPTIRFAVAGPIGGEARGHLDTQPLAQFLTQRALEREQARVEAMQAMLLERQRLRREARYYAAVQGERERLADEIQRADEALRVKAEEEVRRKAEEAAREKAEAEERARAEQATRQRAADEAADEERRKAAKEAAERAADARLAEKERARVEAQPSPVPETLPGVESAPLPPFDARDEPLTQQPGRRSPFRPIENFLRSLGQ
ncbi:MAG TPA: AsmA-like C-terminal region-containing protein [Mesorhizobium sp.]|nr:AsmA-like C-terminal region-containing protein [Mesorhizobium sp.]